jgi:hypothetical protein
MITGAASSGRMIAMSSLLGQDDRRRLPPRLDLLGGKIGHYVVLRIRRIEICYNAVFVRWRPRVTILA